MCATDSRAGAGPSGPFGAQMMILQASDATHKDGDLVFALLDFGLTLIQSFLCPYLSFLEWKCLLCAVLR